MSLDGKLLARAKTRLDQRRVAGEEARERRKREVYARSPRVREIEERLRGTVIDAVGAALSRGEDPRSALDALREENLSLQEERALTLAALGYPPDYLEERYVCSRCRDTGYDGTELCSCLMDLYREEQRKELSGLLKLGEETFDSFDLNYYDGAPDPRTGLSPRQSMEVVYETCLQYALNFSPRSMNLFLTGGTGLGKTFLSTCIAKVVSERGFSVVYDTAGAVFARYEEVKFSRGEDVGQSRAELRRVETCDLLILDDLGTEMATSFVTSALYTLLNTRLVTGKRMVVSSNLSMRDLAARYSPAVMSRLQGEFTVLPFYGQDIRLLRRNRRRPAPEERGNV